MALVYVGVLSCYLSPVLQIWIIVSGDVKVLEIKKNVKRNIFTALTVYNTLFYAFLSSR